MNKHFYFLCLIALFFVPSCVTKKPVMDSQLKEEYKKLAVYNIPYTWFEGKCNTSYTGGFDELSFNTSFRIQKDKVIWISLTGPLSIEGGRALITPDSVQIVDRINKKYYCGTFNGFAVKYNLPITFSLLQELIVGNVVNENTLKTNTKYENDYKVFSEHTNTLDKNVYINLKNYTLEKIGLKDRLTQRELLLNFANYIAYKGHLFANDRKIEINAQHEKSTIQMEFNKISFDQKLEFPFSIPEKYEVVTL